MGFDTSHFVLFKTLHLTIFLGRPYPLENCKLGNSTGSFGVLCDPGFDGGLTQAFNLEVMTFGVLDLSKCIATDLGQF